MDQSLPRTLHLLQQWWWMLGRDRTVCKTTSHQCSHLTIDARDEWDHQNLHTSISHSHGGRHINYGGVKFGKESWTSLSSYMACLLYCSRSLLNWAWANLGGHAPTPWFLLLYSYLPDALVWCWKAVAPSEPIPQTMYWFRLVGSMGLSHVPLSAVRETW